VEQVAGGLELFPSQRGDAEQADDHRHAVHGVSGDGPAALVVPGHAAVLQRDGVLRGRGGHMADRTEEEEPVRSTYRVERDVEVRHGDQTRHGEVGGGAGEEDGAQVALGADAVSPEEGLLGVWGAGGGDAPGVTAVTDTYLWAPNTPTSVVYPDGRVSESLSL